MNSLAIKLENDRIFTDWIYEMPSEYFPSFPLTDNPREGHFSVQDHTVNMTTIECIISNKGRKTAALNFANANFPGGAYVLGGNAQEESLCRSSLLYYTIKECGEYYRKNRLHILPDYTDGIIYSEDVLIIRDDSGNRLDEKIYSDFITCPAVNRRFARPLMSDRHIDSVMERRIGKIISLAASKEPELVVLGAFGCGVFGNEREKVFRMFESAIDRFGGNRTEYIFAVPSK